MYVLCDFKISEIEKQVYLASFIVSGSDFSLIYTKTYTIPVHVKCDNKHCENLQKRTTKISATFIWDIRMGAVRVVSEILFAPPLVARAKLVGPVFSVFSISRLLSPQSDANVTLPVSVVSASVCKMSQKPALSSEKSWKDLQEYYDKSGKSLVIKELFAKDPNRFSKFRWGVVCRVDIGVTFGVFELIWIFL